MISRRHVLAVLTAAATAAGATLAFAKAGAPFDLQAFEAAQAAGKPILVDVRAAWCGICRAQAPVIERVTNDERYKRLVRFNVDFDSQKDVLKKLGAHIQSTLIAYRGKDEVGRLVGDTGEAAIDRLVSRSFQ